MLQSLADAAALALYNVQLDADLKAALRQERDARESAESASRLKDEFLALLSHELRTPLHVINNWLWQLKQGKSIQPAILAKALEVIERNTALQSRLVDDLLDVSRAAAGKLSIDSQLVQLGTLCAAAIEAAQPAAREKSITLNLLMRRQPEDLGRQRPPAPGVVEPVVERDQVFAEGRPSRAAGVARQTRSRASR